MRNVKWKNEKRQNDKKEKCVEVKYKIKYRK